MWSKVCFGCVQPPPMPLHWTVRGMVRAIRSTGRGPILSIVEGPSQRSGGSGWSAGSAVVSKEKHGEFEVCHAREARYLQKTLSTGLIYRARGLAGVAATRPPESR